MPLGLSEAPKAVGHLPMAFVKHAATISLVAVAGLVPGQSALISPEGNWLASYLPNQLRAYPFVLATNQTGDFVLCIDDDSGLIEEGNISEPFFSVEGALSETVRQAMAMLTSHERDKIACNRLVAELDSFGLLQPWKIRIESPSGPKNIEGIFCVSEEALNEILDEEFIVLRKSNALTLAYCQMLSMQTIAPLVRLVETKIANSLLFAASAPMELDFSGLQR